MIKLVPMSEADFEAYLTQSIADYAAEHAKSGNMSSEQALKMSKKQFAELLPNGVASQDQYLFNVVDEKGAKVGLLWFAKDKRSAEPTAFVYDVVIFEQFRRRGYATQTFEALEELVRKMGMKKIRLHVFGHNHGARELYEKLGFVPTNIQMAKTLDTPPTD